MQPSDIHFAAVWPTAHDGTGRKVRVLALLELPTPRRSFATRTPSLLSAILAYCTPLRTAHVQYCSCLQQVVVPFQCSLADASKTVGCLAAQRHNTPPPAISAIDTSALGESPVVEEPTLLLFSLLCSARTSFVSVRKALRGVHCVVHAVRCP